MSQYDTRHPSDFMSSSSSNMENGEGRDILYSALNLHKDNNAADEDHRLNRLSTSDRWPVIGHPTSSQNHHHGNGAGHSHRSSCLSPGIFARQQDDIATNRSTRTLYPPGGSPTQTSGPLHPGATDRRSSPLALITSSEGGSTGTRKGPSVNRIKSYHCRMCDQEFQSKSDMQHHSKNVHRLEDKGHKCTKCFKSFPSSQQLAQHLLVHTNVRKYLCRFCDKAFKQLSHVQQHQRIHTGERPYKCTVESCSKAFRQLSSLQQHLKGHNILNMKSYPVSRNSSTPLLESTTINQLPSNLARPHDLTCQVCEKHCADEIRFFHHIHKYHADYWRVFSGGRPLSDFIESHEMKRREKPYRCAVCNKCYSHENGYVKHLATHPDSLPDVRMQLFSCAVCDKFFTKEAYLLRHMEMKLDDLHCAGLEQLKKNSPMFRTGVVDTTTLYTTDVGLGRSHSFQNGTINPNTAAYSTTTTTTTSNNNNNIQALSSSSSSSEVTGPCARPRHLIPYRHDLSTGVAVNPYLGQFVSSSRQDVQLKVDPGSPAKAPSTANQGLANPRSVSHMIDVSSPGSSASGSCSPTHFTYLSEHQSGFDGLARGLRAHDQYPLRLQSPVRRSEVNHPATFGKALNSGGDQVAQSPYYTQSYSQSPRSHLSRYLSDPLHCSTEDNGCYFSSPFSYLPHFQGLPTTSAPSNSLPGRISPRPFVHPSIVPFPYTLSYRSHT